MEQRQKGKSDPDFFNRLSVIEQNLVEREVLRAQAEGAIAQGLIQTYLALGGGWEIRCTPQDNCQPLGPIVPPPDAPAAQPSACGPRGRAPAHPCRGKRGVRLTRVISRDRGEGEKRRGGEEERRGHPHVSLFPLSPLLPLSSSPLLLFACHRNGNS